MKNRAARRRAAHRTVSGKLREYPITVDIESRMSAMELGTRMHQEIEHVMSGDYHIGDHHIGMSDEMLNRATFVGVDQLRAYAQSVHGDVPMMIVHGGDFYDEPLVRQPDGLVSRDGHLYAYDWKLAQEVLDNAMRAMLRTVNPDEKINL